MDEVASSVRQTNLLLALNLCLQQNRPLTVAWAMSNVEGYLPDLPERLHPKQNTINNVAKQLSRDIKAWQEAGIPITGTNSTGYQLDEQAAFLPAIDFTPEELDLLAQVSALAVNNSFSEHARLGLLKLLSQVAWDEQTAAAEEDPDAAATSTAARSLSTNMHATVDWNTSDPTDIAQLTQAIQQHTVLSFRYPRRGEKPQETPQRLLTPWALVSHHNRLYVVGWDMEQQAQRLFRYGRMQDLSLSDTTGVGAPEDFDGAKAVDDWFDSHDEHIDARIFYAGDQDLLLLADATRVGPHEYQLSDVSRAWLIRAAIAAAPQAVVVEPPELRAEIRSLMERAHKNLETA